MRASTAGVMAGPRGRRLAALGLDKEARRCLSPLVLAINMIRSTPPDDGHALRAASGGIALVRPGDGPLGVADDAVTGSLPTGREIGAPGSYRGAMVQAKVPHR